MTKPRILIIEDEKIAALELKEFLEEKGFMVDTPDGSPNKAVEAVCCADYDLILMDINLNSFIDGIDATQRIQIMQDIPIIYITSYPDSDIKQRAMKTRPAAYIEKPINSKYLLKTINKALKRDPQIVN